MLLTLLALAAVLLVLEEGFSRLLRQLWQATRWFILPPVGALVAYTVPLGLITYPVFLDTVTSILFGITIGALFAVHGTFRDGHWRALTQKRTSHHPHAMHRQPQRPLRAAPPTPSTGATVRAPLKTRP